MLQWWINRQMDRFEKDLAYDMSYGRDLLATSTRAAMLFFRATAIGEYRESIPVEAWHAVKLVASRAEDCGPCVQVCVKMAEREGVAAESLRAILRGDFEAAPQDMRLAAEFTRAVLGRDPAAESLRREIVARFGKRGLVSVAFAMLSARMYPLLKYALGYGHACAVVYVDGAPVLAPREAV